MFYRYVLKNKYGQLYVRYTTKLRKHFKVFPISNGMKKLPYILIANALAFVLFPLFALAAASGAPASAQLVCNLQINIDKLIAIKDQGNKDTGDNELNAYTELLQNVFTCSITEIESFEAKLNALANLSERDTETKTVFLDNLENLKTYYQNTEEELKSTGTVEEQKQLAAKVLSWKKETYNPQVKNIANFIFVFHGKEAIALANARLRKISLTLLDAGLLFKKENWRDFNILLNKSQADIKNADKLNGQAYAILADQLNPQSTSSTATIASNTTGTKATITDTLKESLLNIKAAYEAFGEIGALVKKILG